MTSATAKRETGLEGFEEAFEGFVGAIRRARGRAEHDLTGGLSLSQYNLIEPLLERSPQPVGELAAAAGIAPPSATRMIDGLERGGVVSREPSPDDRRVVAVRLTAKGGRCARAKRDHMHTRRRALYESLDTSDRERVARLLHGIAEMIDEL